MYCMDAKAHGFEYPVNMTHAKADFVVIANDETRLVRGRLYECPECGKKTIVGLELFDFVEDRQSFKVIKERAEREKCIVKLADNNYMWGRWKETRAIINEGEGDV